MNRNRFPGRSQAARRSLLLAALVTGFASAQAGETLFNNSAFDTGAPGWNWENWSAADSTATFDATQNSPVSGGAPTSGSLKLVNGFTSVAGYQQAVFTLQLPSAQNFVGQVGALSFDVKVDDTSTARATGDFGWLEVILRQGNNWDWVGLPGVRLEAAGWQRVTFQVPKAGVDSIRAITLKLGENDFLGPVTLNIDSVAFLTNPDDVAVTGVDNGVAGVAPDGWSWESWSVTGVASYDPNDTHGRSTSGTVKLEHNFENKPDDYQQTVFTYVLPGGQVNAAQEYSSVNLDVKVDAASTPRAGGDYGWFQLFLRNGSNWDWLGTEINGAAGIRISDNDWQHLSFKVAKTADAVHRLTFKIGENALLGPVILNIDNITFTRSTTPPPPPTLTLTPAKGGLSLVTTSTDQYGRHNVFTADDPGDPSKFAFVGSAEPGSYSFTLASFPDATLYPGFQAHIFLVPGAPGNETTPDWNEPTIIFMDIKGGANGSGNATFRIKTQQPNGNSELYVAGLTTVNSTSVAGTWTLTANGQIFTMTAPDGTVSAPIDIGADAVALFAAGDVPLLRAYFGVQPNADGNKGQSVRVGKLEIKKGASVLLTDDFSGPEFDTTKWTANASAGGVLFISPADAGYLVAWTLPDTGFILQISTSLTTPNWANLDVTAATIGQSKQAVLAKSALPAGDQAYIRMIKPAP